MKIRITVVEQGVTQAAKSKDRNKKQKIFKSWALFTDFISEINNRQINNYNNFNNYLNLISPFPYCPMNRECHVKKIELKKKTGIIVQKILVSFCQYSDSKTFKFKSGFIDKTDDTSTTNLKEVAPLKCFGSFWRKLEILLFNCENNLILTCSAVFVVFEIYAETTFAETFVKTLCCSSSRFVDSR